MKIFIGCHEIANVQTLFAEAFRDIGHSVQTFVFSKNPYYLSNNYDFIADSFYKKISTPLKNTSLNDKIYRRYKNWYARRVLKKVIDNTDLFVFIWSSLLPNNEDLKFIKDHGKKIIFINCGTDVRHSDPFLQEYGIDKVLWRRDFPNDPLNKKLSYLRNMEMFADAIFSLPDQAGLAIRPYFHLKIPFLAEKIEFKLQQNEIPNVVHCPTRRFIKGSDKIEEVLKKLEEEGVKFNYRKVVNVPNTELLRILEETDVVVDELILPGPGVLGFEAMAAGCVECTRHDKNENANWNPPVVNIDNENIYEQLKIILTNKSLREELSRKGREYVLLNHNPQKVVSEILSKIQLGSEPHYTPTFFIEKFKPEEEKINDDLKSKSLEVLKKYGNFSQESIADAINRGILPWEVKN